MEQLITPTVLWSWLVGCGLWLWSQHRQSRREVDRLSARQWLRLRQIRQGILTVFSAAFVVIVLYWPGLLTRSWLLPIPELDQPLINRVGLLLMRLSIGWLVIIALQWEPFHYLWWRHHTWTSRYSRHKGIYHNQQAALAGAGLLLGLFISLSGAVTALLCLIGWWLGWRFWQVNSHI